MLLVAVAAIAVFGLWSHRAGAPGSPAQPADSRHFRIAMRNFAFEPREVTVTVGTTVDWIDTEGKHGIQFDDSSVTADQDEALEVGGSISRTFQEPGRYPYHCVVHGGAGGKGMSGVVIVAPQ